VKTAKRTPERPSSPAPASAAPPAPAEAPADRRSGAWVGDRVAFVFWLCAAATLAFMLLKDLVYGLLFR
jgi:hypothetical protein